MIVMNSAQKQSVRRLPTPILLAFIGVVLVGGLITLVSWMNPAPTTQVRK